MKFSRSLIVLKILPYKNGSASAKALAEASGFKLLNRKLDKPIKADTIVNWGSSEITRRHNAIVINKPECVAVAKNKLETFKKLQATCPLPAFTESRVEASRWLAEGDTVVCRTLIESHSGNGIVIAEKEEELVDAPLYTKYIKKKDEYRYHVFGDEWFVQRKARKLDVENPNWKIRNHANGFVFAHQGVLADQKALPIAGAAINTIGLTFGAVDMVYGTDKKWYILEVNTAPGLEPEGACFKWYLERLRELV
jgi:glutathione synthase/RimK-type ligase-like ATP-grasp enzyme